MQSKPVNRPVPARPAPQFCANARQVVTDPARYRDRPIIRRLAWIALMAERGNAVDQLRLAQMQAGMAR